TLIGQEAAEAEFLEAYNADRMHHAWLLTGARGVGKATLAWRVARFLLAEVVTAPAEADKGNESGLFTGPANAGQLDISVDHPLSRRILALSEPRLFFLRRAWDDERKRLKTVITVDEVRKLRKFFALSAVDGGRRVVIVDDADEMNNSAANALLKVLEEPPENAVLILVSHRPSGLLATIRSRCRTLRLTPLAPDDMALALSGAGADIRHADRQDVDPSALATLAAGSVGEALRLLNLGGLTAYRDIVALFATLPALERPRLLKLAESAVGKAAAERFELLLGLFDMFLARLARSGVAGKPLMEAAPGEAALFARLAPDAGAGRVWAALQQELGARARHGRAVNLDPAALILDMGFRIDETAAKWAAR
ncbi:MAG: DNA polymerase III subunit delta', partial [Halocynthiibacter sp.]